MKHIKKIKKSKTTEQRFLFGLTEKDFTSVLVPYPHSFGDCENIYGNLKNLVKIVGLCSHDDLGEINNSRLRAQELSKKRDLAIELYERQDKTPFEIIIFGNSSTKD